MRRYCGKRRFRRTNFARRPDLRMELSHAAEFRLEPPPRPRPGDQRDGGRVSPKTSHTPSNRRHSWRWLGIALGIVVVLGKGTRGSEPRPVQLAADEPVQTTPTDPTAPMAPGPTET